MKKAGLFLFFVFSSAYLYAQEARVIYRFSICKLDIATGKWTDWTPPMQVDKKFVIYDTDFTRLVLFTEQKQIFNTQRFTFKRELERDGNVLFSWKATTQNDELCEVFIRVLAKGSNEDWGRLIIRYSDFMVAYYLRIPRAGE